MARPLNAPQEICAICENRFDWRKNECPKHDCNAWPRSDVSAFRSRTDERKPAYDVNDPRCPLIERIKAKGFQTRGKQVLWNNERYIDPEEWVRKMPDVKL
jgi:hypothetical protein